MLSRRKVSLGLAAGLVAPTVVSAQTAWDMSTPYTEGTFHTQNVRWFVEQIATTTSNALRVQVHSNNSLIRLPEILRAVSTGQVAAGEIFLSQFGNEEPIYDVDAIPFLTADVGEAKALYAASKTAIEETLRRRGIRLLYSVAWPSQAFFSKTPISSAADMRAMRFRTQSPMTSRMAELLGAVPTAVQGSEIPQAFATNIVTGMVTSSVTGVQSRAWEFCSHVVNLRAFMPKNAVIVNERAWQRLAVGVRQAVEQHAAAAETRGWQLAEVAEAQSFAELERNGMNVTEPSAALKADSRAAGATMSEEWKARAGAKGSEILSKFRSLVTR